MCSLIYGQWLHGGNILYGVSIALYNAINDDLYNEKTDFKYYKNCF
jgi:hypothetical protein